MPSPLVSVVVSAYNRPLFLEQGLLSVAGQTYRNLEILVQDDSTVDECGQVVRAHDDARMQYVRNVPSLGTIGNLRSGYGRATGKYVCTLNDDDLYLPTYVETMVRALEENPECCLAFADHFIVDDAGVVDASETSINSRRFGRDELKSGVIESALHVALIAKSVPGMFAVYRRELMDFNDFPDEVSSGYDYWLIYLATRSQRPIFFCSERLTSYRVHCASQTSSFANPEQRLRSLGYDRFTTERFLADPRLESIHAELVQRLSRIFTSFGSAWLRLGERRNALRNFVAALRIRVNADAIAGVGLALAPAFVADRIVGLRGKAH